MDFDNRARIAFNAMNNFLTGRFLFEHGCFSSARASGHRVNVLGGLWLTYLQELGLWQPGQLTPFPGYAKHPTQVELFTGVSPNSLARLIWEAEVVNLSLRRGMSAEDAWSEVAQLMKEDFYCSISKRTGPNPESVTHILTEGFGGDAQASMLQRIAYLLPMPSDLHRVMDVYRYYFLPAQQDFADAPGYYVHPIRG